ncbi:MAG TPA: GIY-YIG nuclease family protein [Candidatus Scatomonas merdigallinarum]|nr:GIY-YIG nuclease family protein [Candidatus Scatomonas merdigallinarum]
MNYTYIVKCRDNTYYTGWTKDLDRRMKAHNSGTGAKYTRSRRPVRLVYYEAYRTKEEAMRREREIKRMSRKEKEKLIADG